MNEADEREETVIIHEAATWTEAVVIRGLLESAGIPSPSLTHSDPFPLGEPPEGAAGVEILVRASQAEEARKLLASCLAASQGKVEDDSADS